MELIELDFKKHYYNACHRIYCKYNLDFFQATYIDIAVMQF